MEWIERWNRAMDEIELSLTGEIDCERLGRIACCSAYHFQRMFTYLAGVPLGEYVRRRRMSLAAADFLPPPFFALHFRLRLLFSRSTPMSCRPPRMSVLCVVLPFARLPVAIAPAVS